MQIRFIFSKCYQAELKTKTLHVFSYLLKYMLVTLLALICVCDNWMIRELVFVNLQDYVLVLPQSLGGEHAAEYE